MNDFDKRYHNNEVDSFEDGNNITFSNDAFIPVYTQILESRGLDYRVVNGLDPYGVRTVICPPENYNRVINGLRREIERDEEILSRRRSGLSEAIQKNVGTQYVLGITLNKEKTLAAFVRKNRPVWQAGKLNGFGGKIEPKEAPIEAMVREFREESGVDTVAEQWRYLGKFFRTSTDETAFCVHAFVLADDCVNDITQTEDEKIIWSKLDLNEIRENGVSNLSWIVGMALDQDSFAMEVSYD